MLSEAEVSQIAAWVRVQGEAETSGKGGHWGRKRTWERERKRERGTARDSEACRSVQELELNIVNTLSMSK